MSCDPLNVVFPKANQVTSQDFSIQDTHLIIKVIFDQPVDQSSVIVGKTFVVETEKDPNAAGTLTWTADSKTVTYRSTKNYFDLLIFDSDGAFTLKLIGTDTGKGAIKSIGGAFLDGDNDMSSGGNYSTSFNLIG